MAEGRLEKIPRRVIRSHPSCSGCRSLSRAIASRPAIAMRSTLRFFFVPANGRSLLRYYCSWRTGWSFFFHFFSTTSFSLRKNSLARHLLSSLAFYFFLFPFFFARIRRFSLLVKRGKHTPDKFAKFLQLRVLLYIATRYIYESEIIYILYTRNEMWILSNNLLHFWYNCPCTVNIFYPKYILHIVCFFHE